MFEFNKMIFIPFFFIFSFFPSLAQAAIKIQSVTGASNWVLEGDTVIIYGGFAGSESTNCADNGDGTCNNCIVGTQIAACNERRVMLNSQLQISISSDSVSKSGPIILTSSDGNTKIGSNGDTVGKDQIGTFKATWSTICASIFASSGGASCVTSTDPSPVTVKIGIDENSNNILDSNEGVNLTIKVHLPVNADTIEYCSNTSATFTDGVCGFSVFPGDKKVYIEDLEPTSTFPAAGLIQFTKARFFYSTTGFTYGAEGPNPGSNFGYKDIDIVTENDSYFLADKSIRLPDNNTYYFFRIGMLDQANNVSFITSDTAIRDACGKDATQLGGNPTDDNACPFIARTDEVEGLLRNDLNCFIATASYGSSLHPHLQTFRHFRNKFLLNSSWGKKWVKSYYRWGSKGASWLNQHPSFKSPARFFLWPIWLIAWCSLTLGLGTTALLLILVISFFISLFFYLRRKKAVLIIGFLILSLPFHFSALANTQESQKDPQEVILNTGEKLVPHPLAEKGLIRIKNDGTYLYRTELSKSTRASSFRFGMYEPTELSNPDTGVDFSTLYEHGYMPIILYDYEWQFWQGFLGRWGWKVGTGGYVASGHGAFQSIENASNTPRENLTFIALPNNLALIYRLHLWDRQPLVPFAEGGIDAITFAEVRDDNKGPKFGLGTAAHVAGGISFNLGTLDFQSLLTLDREYGISGIWLTIEYRMMIAINKKFDFSNNFLNGGVLVEF